MSSDSYLHMCIINPSKNFLKQVLHDLTKIQYDHKKVYLSLKPISEISSHYVYTKNSQVIVKKIFDYVPSSKGEKFPVVQYSENKLFMHYIQSMTSTFRRYNILSLTLNDPELINKIDIALKINVVL